MNKHSRRLKQVQDKVDKLLHSRSGYVIRWVERGEDIEDVTAAAQKASPLNKIITLSWGCPQESTNGRHSDPGRILAELH